MKHPTNPSQIDHAVSDEHNHPSKTGSRQIGRKGTEGEYACENQQATKHARHLAPRAGLKIDRRSCKGARGRVTAEQAGSDVCHSLADQLLICVEMFTTLPGNLARYGNRLNEAESGNRKRTREKGTTYVAIEDPSDREIGEMQNLARNLADNSNTEPINANNRYQYPCGDEGHEGAGQLSRKPVYHQDGQHRRASQYQAREMELVDIPGQVENRMKNVGTPRNIDVHEISELAYSDQHTSAGGKAEQHRARYEVDQHPDSDEP
ncbi:MAG: hypothetical protein P8127_15045 [Acidobacteriota bacterium]